MSDLASSAKSQTQSLVNLAGRNGELNCEIYMVCMPQL